MSITSPLSRKNQRNTRQHPPLAHPRAHFLIFLPVFSLSNRSSVYLHANQSSYRSTSGVPTAYFYGSLTNYRRSKRIYISFVLWGDYRGGIIGKGVWGETIKGGPSRGTRKSTQGNSPECFIFLLLFCPVHSLKTAVRRPKVARDSMICKQSHNDGLICFQWMTFSRLHFDRHYFAVSHAEEVRPTALCCCPTERRKLHKTSVFRFILWRFCLCHIVADFASSAKLPNAINKATFFVSLRQSFSFLFRHILSLKQYTQNPLTLKPSRAAAVLS